MSNMNVQNEDMIDLMQIFESENVEEKLIEAGYQIDLPPYIEMLGEKAESEINHMMIKAVNMITNGDSFFTLKDLQRKFDTLLEAKIKIPKNAQYLSSNNKLSKKMTTAQLARIEEAKRLAERNIEMLKPYIVSEDKGKIFDYFVEKSLNLIPVGDHDPESMGKRYFTTQEMIDCENTILEYAINDEDDFVIKDSEMVKEALAKKTLISEEQTEAVYECVYKKERISIVEGVAGAGKSFTMEVVKEAYEKSGYAIMGTALSWNAAGVLRGSAKIDKCEAIEGLVRKIESTNRDGKEYFNGDTLLIVDEAGLIGVKHMAKLLKLTGDSKHKVKVVLTGDSDQLDPVTAGASLSLLMLKMGSKVIETIRRQALKSHQNMVYAFRDLRSGHGLNYLYQQEAIHFCDDNESTLNRMVMDFVNYKYNNPDKTALLLALTNSDVISLNESIRGMCKKMGWVYGVETTPIDVTDGNRAPWKAQFAVGDEVSLRLNNKDIPVYEIPEGDERKPIHEKNLNVSEWVQTGSGVFNRNNGKVIGVSKMEDGSYTLIIEMVGDVSGRILINTKKYMSDKEMSKHEAFPVVHNYATTIYASQGQTVDAVFMKDGSKLDFRLAYVGASRHREEFNVYANVEELVTRISNKEKKELPDEVLKENTQTNNFEFRPNLMPVAARFNHEAYLGEMSSSWGRFTKKMTVTEYEFLEKEKKLSSKNKSKTNERKSMFTIEDDTKPKIEGVEIVDTCIPDFVAPRNMSLIEVAVEKGIIKDINKASDSRSKEYQVLISWIEKTMKMNDLDPQIIDLKKGQELYFAKSFKSKLPKKVDFYKLGEMSEKEILNSKDAKKIDMFEQEMQAFEDRDNKIKLNREKIKDLKEREDSKKSQMFGSEKMFDELLNSAFVESIKENEKRDPRSRDNVSDFSFQDYAKSDRYAKDMSKTGGGLNRKEIEVFAKRNRVLPPKIDIPLLPDFESDAYVDNFGSLRFKSDESVELNQDQKDELDSLTKFIDNKKGTYWNVVRFKQPRIIATDLKTVKSRYDLEGNCVSGLGYPPTIFSPVPNDCKMVCIVPNFKSAMMTSRHFYIKKFATKLTDQDTKEDRYNRAKEVPNVIWGAKDVDWGLILKEHPEYAQKMIILVGKNPSNKEVIWAKELQEKIYDQYDLKVNISGNMPSEFKNVFDVRISKRAKLESQKRSPHENTNKMRM